MANGLSASAAEFSFSPSATEFSFSPSATLTTQSMFQQDDGLSFAERAQLEQQQFYQQKFEQPSLYDTQPGQYYDTGEPYVTNPYNEDQYGSQVGLEQPQYLPFNEFGTSTGVMDGHYPENNTQQFQHGAVQANPYAEYNDGNQGDWQQQSPDELDEDSFRQIEAAILANELQAELYDGDTSLSFERTLQGVIESVAESCTDAMMAQFLELSDEELAWLLSTLAVNNATDSINGSDGNTKKAQNFAAVTEEDFPSLSSAAAPPRTIKASDRSIEDNTGFHHEQYYEKYEDPEKYGKIACRYYVLGKCYRADCWYSHDLAQIKCRHLSEGLCIKGEDCEFMHDGPQANINRLLLQGMRKLRSRLEDMFRPDELAEDEKEEFPDLSLEAAAAAAARAAEIPGGLSHAAMVRVTKLQQMYPTIDPDNIWTLFLDCDQDFDVTLCQISSYFPDVKPLKVGDTNMAKERMLQSIGTSSISAPKRTLKKVLRISEYVGGPMLSEKAMQLRKQALLEGKQQARFYQAASEAYLHGKGAQAKKLSEQGHVHAKRMRDLHKQAAEKILGIHNKDNPSNVLDVHHLYVSEAEAYVDLFLDNCYRNGVSEAYIITGAGHHSEKNKSRLYPAMTAFLKDMGYWFREVDPDGDRGSLLVDLTRAPKFRHR